MPRLKALLITDPKPMHHSAPYLMHHIMSLHQCTTSRTAPSNAPRAVPQLVWVECREVAALRVAHEAGEFRVPTHDSALKTQTQAQPQGSRARAVTRARTVTVSGCGWEGGGEGGRGGGEGGAGVDLLPGLNSVVSRTVSD